MMFTGGWAGMRALFVELGGRLPAASVRRQAGVETTASGPSDTRLDPAAFEVALTEYQHRDFSLVDVVRAGCTKGSALAAWAASRGLSADQVMAVGDNLNDLQMLEFAGTPVLMGNAVAELKNRGWPVTLGNDESGVARAIDTYVFGP